MKTTTGDYVFQAAEFPSLGCVENRVLDVIASQMRIYQRQNNEYMLLMKKAVQATKPNELRSVLDEMEQHVQARFKTGV